VTLAAEYAYPPRIVQIARDALAKAYTGRAATVVDRLYSYEIQDAARQLARASGERAVRITAIGERVTFAPVEHARP
jgi:hypothetical protein